MTGNGYESPVTLFYIDLNVENVKNDALTNASAHSFSKTQMCADFY